MGAQDEIMFEFPLVYWRKMWYNVMHENYEEGFA